MKVKINKSLLKQRVRSILKQSFFDPDVQLIKKIGNKSNDQLRARLDKIPDALAAVKLIEQPKKTQQLKKIRRMQDAIMYLLMRNKGRSLKQQRTPRQLKKIGSVYNNDDDTITYRNPAYLISELQAKLSKYDYNPQIKRKAQKLVSKSYEQLWKSLDKVVGITHFRQQYIDSGSNVKEAYVLGNRLEYRLMLKYIKQLRNNGMTTSGDWGGPEQFI